MSKLILILVILIFAVSLANSNNCESLGNELVKNGSFDNGFDGFYTKYVYIITPPMYNTGSCTVTNNPSSFFSGWKTFPDKSPSNNNLMFLADASINPNLVLIGTDVNVQKNALYKFSLWVARVNNAGPPTIKVSINKQAQISKKITVSDGVWVNVEFEWNSSNSDVANIEIFNTDPAQYGNDFVIDEISLKPCGIVDLQAPQISISEECYKIKGVVFDSTITDTGILSYSSPESSKINCMVNFGKLSDNARSIGFESKLIDIKYDGSFRIEASDYVGQKTSKIYDIKGFTVGINGDEMSDNPPFVNEVVPTNNTKCFRIYIRNYGKFQQNIKSYKLSNPSVYSVSTNFPITVNPGAVISVDVCFYSKDENIFLDSLILINECDYHKNFGNFKISTKIDKYPQISSIEECYKISGFIYDSTSNDSGIMNYRSPDSYINNCTVTFGKLSDDARSISFLSQLNDKSYDASFVIEATDSNNQTSSEKFNIKGFTVGFDGYEFSDELISINDTIKTSKKSCYNFKLHNYGNFEQVINKISFGNSTNFEINNIFPFTIKPSETENIEVCFSSTLENIYIDSLSIENNCSDSKYIVQFAIWAIEDRNTPSHKTNLDTCAKEYIILVNDSLKWDSGIADIIIKESNNCDIIITSRTLQTAVIQIKYIKYNHDMSFSIQISDSSGNSILISDSIKYKEIEISGIDDMSPKTKIFKDAVYNTISKDSIIIYNMDDQLLVIDNLYLKNNINFSIPPSQFPIKINPKDSACIIICFYPDKLFSYQYTDTLYIDSYCLNHEVILKGVGTSIEDTINSKCKIELVLNSLDNVDGNLIESIYPNPTSYFTTFVFNNDFQSLVMIDLYNSTGILIKNLLSDEVGIGKFETTLSFENMQSGLYFIKLSTSFNTEIRPILILK